LRINVKSRIKFDIEKQSLTLVLFAEELGVTDLF